MYKDYLDDLLDHLAMGAGRQSTTRYQRLDYDRSGVIDSIKSVALVSITFEHFHLKWDAEN